MPAVSGDGRAVQLLPDCTGRSLRLLRRLRGGARMTTLSRPVRRKVTTLRGEELVVVLLPEGIQLREPRRRTAFLLPYGTAFIQAVRLHVDAERRAKAA